MSLQDTVTDDVGGLWADSPALGTGLVPRPCGEKLRPASPAPSGDPVAVALSGGGFRATLAGAGALLLLANAGLLRHVRFLSSVSGGSITNGVTAQAWPTIRSGGYSADAVRTSLVEPLVSRVSQQSLKSALLRGLWRAVGPGTRTDVLARQLDEWFFSGLELERLDPEVRWIINAGNLSNGVRFGFERDVLGDYSSGLLRTDGTGVRLSLAVAASAAVPGPFSPVELKGLVFPCAHIQPLLLDGGIYDNTGLEAIDGDSYRGTFLVALNAGGLLSAGMTGAVPILRDLTRANALLYRQSTALRTRAMVDQFKKAKDAGDGPLPTGARRGVLVALASDVPVDSESDALTRWKRQFPETRTYHGRDLALVPTVFDRLDQGLCRALVYRGWWLVGAALAKYHPSRLGEDFETWTPPES
jgi:NTE family protein